MNIFSVARKEKDQRETRRERREQRRWDPPASLWRDTSRRRSFPCAPTDIDCDVVIVGAGFTGVWTALQLKSADQSLNVVGVDAMQPGFGGSGRNGGWCSALFPVDDDELVDRFGAEKAALLTDELRSTVDSIGAFAHEHGIDCGWVKGGTLTVATSAGGLTRLENGLSPDDRRKRLDQGQLAQRVRVAGAAGAVFDPDCAALNPFALLEGMLDVCLSLGVRIFGSTRATSLHSDHVVCSTDAGLVYVTAGRVVVTVDSYLPRLRGHRRRTAPVYSHVIATERLAQEKWDQIGWEGRETISLVSHTVTYAQRTADGRIVIGSRGAPFPFGSDIHADRDSNESVHTALERLLRECFPAAADTRISHRWGGSLGVTRDRMPGVWSEPGTGIIHAGGFAGDGVALSHLAARIITAHTTGTDDKVLGLPLWGHRPGRWAPEPWRWLTINSRIARARFSRVS